MDDLKGITSDVYEKIGNLASKTMAGHLKNKYHGPSAQGMKDSAKRSTPSDGAKMVDYSTNQDGSLTVKWSDGAITSEPAENADEIHRLLDMSSYGRAVDLRKNAGVHPAMPDPMDVSGTVENKYLKHVIGNKDSLTPDELQQSRDAAKGLADNAYQDKAPRPPAVSMADRALESSPMGADDEEELLARAGK